MSELEEPTAMTDLDMNTILEDLKFFGIEDHEEVLTMTVKGKTVRLRLSNISNEDEIWSMNRASELKGYAWVQGIRCEILANAVTWINGLSVASVPYAKCPITGEERETKAILADMFRMKWGQEAVLVLWKIYMIHCDNMEKRLLDQLPAASISTDTERRFMERVGEELKELGVKALIGTLNETSEEG